MAIARGYERRIHKGTSKSDEKLKLICQIRHEFTNYDKLVYFYDVYENKRRELNREISKLIDKGTDYISTFKENVKTIENYVDLNKKEARKRFIQEQMERHIKSSFNTDKKGIKKTAENMVVKIIKENNRINQLHNIHKGDKYEE